MTDRNANRPGYKKTPVGWIPNEWTAERLVHFFTLQRGYDLTKVTATPGKVPVISSSGLSYYHSEARIDPPGVVTGRKGILGNVFFLEEPFWPHDTSLWVSDFKGNDPHFVCWFLRGLRLERLDAATSVPTLNRNNVHSLKVAFPPLREQKKIAEILSSWDEAIEQTRALILAAKRRKKALMQQLLTGKERLPGFNSSGGRRAVAASGTANPAPTARRPPGMRTRHRFFTTPLDWDFPKLANVASESTERNITREQLTVLTCSKHRGFVESAMYFGKQIFSEDTSNYKVIHRGQFGFPSNHVEEGSIGLLTTHDIGIVSPIYTVFITTDAVLPEFLFAVFKTETYRHIFQISTSGSVDRRGSLRWGEFSLIRVPLPSLPEQRAIAAVLTTADEEIKTLDAKCAALERQKKGLMQKLLTGEVRVEE